ncbi:Putative ribonuclease H protein At1g65750 [Linum grandiflorum]
MELNILCWNVHRVGNTRCQRNIKELKRIHKVDIVIVLETKVEGTRAVEIIRDMGFSNHFLAEAAGRSGGIWLLWDDNRFTLTVLASTPQLVHLLVEVYGKEPWVLSAVYASPSPNIRQQLWSQLKGFAESNSLPWMLIGDLNEITCRSERRGGANSWSQTSFPLHENLHVCGLIDLEFKGPLFTWFRRDSRFGILQQRLDRGIANIRWRHLFPEASLLHLPRTHSDHCPVLLLSGGVASVARNRPFRLEAMWFEEESFRDLVENSITCSHLATPQLLNYLRETFIEWNRTREGNLFQRKARVLGRLKGVERELTSYPSETSWRLHRDLSDEYNSILNMEAIFWQQKSRLHWLLEGDKCTAFFHTTTKVRWKRNKIEGLKLDNGEWCFVESRLRAAMANLRQAGFMQEALEKFCTASGQRVNVGKSVIFASTGTPLSVKSDIINKTGFQLSANLGRYLGVPLIHSRVNKDTYFSVVERVQSRLAGWKSKLLSRTGRETLIHSTLAATPVYTMQSAWLPSSTCVKLDQLSRRFLWGGDANHTRISLVNWEQVCRRRRDGGLGVRQARLINISLLGKLAWQLITGRQSLWTSIFIAKYGDLRTTTPRKSDSPHWKGIRKAYDRLKAWFSWRIDTGSEVCIYDDRWVGDCCIRDLIEYSLPEAAAALRVDSLISGSQWSVSNCPFNIPAACKALIENIPLASFSHGVDRIIWCPSARGCGVEGETLLHVLRDCNQVRHIWDDIVPVEINNFFNLSLKDWFWENINVKGGIRILQLVMSSNTCCHPLGALISDIHSLMEMMQNCKIRHIRREANFVADYIAKSAHDLGDGEKWLSNPPQGVLHLLEADRKGRKYRRGSNPGVELTSREIGDRNIARAASSD